MINRLLIIITWVDGVLALALSILLLTSLTRFAKATPLWLFRWAFGVGVAFSLGWLGLAIYGLRVQEAAQVGEGAENVASLTAHLFLPPSILGAEAGLAGFIGLSKLWALPPLVYGVLSLLLALRIIALLVGPYLR